MILLYIKNKIHIEIISFCKLAQKKKKKKTKKIIPTWPRSTKLRILQYALRSSQHNHVKDPI